MRSSVRKVTAKYRAHCIVRTGALSGKLHITLLKAICKCKQNQKLKWHWQQSHQVVEKTIATRCRHLDNKIRVFCKYYVYRDYVYVGICGKVPYVASWYLLHFPVALSLISCQNRSWNQTMRLRKTCNAHRFCRTVYIQCGNSRLSHWTQGNTCTCTNYQLDNI